MMTRAGALVPERDPSRDDYNDIHDIKLYFLFMIPVNIIIIIIIVGVIVILIMMKNVMDVVVSAKLL